MKIAVLSDIHGNLGALQAVLADVSHRGVDLIVNPSNCVQCGAITAKGGRLTTPEGGDGPLYQNT